MTINLAEWDDVCILTGDQWGPFAVTTRVIDGPPGVVDEWEDIVEFSLTASGPLVIAELVNHDPTTELLTEPGTYRIRVSARGRSKYLEDDDAADEWDERRPVEHYLIEAWAAEPRPPAVVRLTSRHAETLLAGPQPEPIIEGQEAGLAGAAAIGRDVDRAPGARELSGQTGSITVSRRIPGTRRRLFSRHLKLAAPFSTHIPSWSLDAGPGWEKVGAPTVAAASESHPDQLSGDTGMIRNIVLEEDAPRRRVREWAWLVPAAGRTGGSPEERLVFAETTITTTYTQTRDADGRVTTLIEVTHEGLPIEWLENMRAWWLYQLAFMEQLETYQS